MISSSTPKSSFQRYQRRKQSESAKSGTGIVTKERADLMSPKLQKKNETSHKSTGSSRSSNSGILLCTPSPSLIRFIPPSSSTMPSPKSTAAAAAASAAVLHAFRMSATPSPLALQIRQQILKSNEQAAPVPAVAAPISLASPKRSIFFTSSSPRGPSCATRGSSTPRASLVSPSVTPMSASGDRTLLQTNNGSVASPVAASFQSPSLKMDTTTTAETRSSTPFTKTTLISPASSLHENSSNTCHHTNSSSTVRFDTSPKTPLQEASSTKPQSSNMPKANIPQPTTHSKVILAKKVVVANVDNKTIVAPRSWSHEELMDWMARHELLDDKNSSNNNKSSSSSRRIPCHVNGQMVMRMSKAQLLASFYDNNDCIVNKKKAETLFRRLRLESDRADRSLLKKRAAGIAKASIEK